MTLIRRVSISTRIPIVCGVLGFFLVAGTQVFTKNRADLPKALLSPPPHLEKFSFGYNEVLADSFWIRAFQDFDYCNKPASKTVCQNNSWLYEMLDTVTNLSPHFRMPYAVGGLALTVIITDVGGATKIFDKGVKEFPQDWPILYRAAYHYLYEVNDKKRAAELLIQAGKYGAPEWVYTLAGRLYSDSGNLVLAEALLQEMKDAKQDPTLIERLEKKIESIKTQNTSK